MVKERGVYGKLLLKFKDKLGYHGTPNETKSIYIILQESSQYDLLIDIINLIVLESLKLQLIYPD